MSESNPFVPKKESEVQVAEARSLYEDLIKMDGHYNHDQYVRLLSVSKHYRILPDKDFEAFLDIRDPFKFQAICCELRSLLIVELAHVGDLPVPEKFRNKEVSSQIDEVKFNISSVIQPRS